MSKENIRKVIKINHKNILSLLKEMIECNSFSYSKAGNDKMQEIIRPNMQNGYKMNIIHHDKVGDNYMYAYGNGKNQRAILLHGHMDTLCQKDTHFNTLYDKGSKLYGPGVNDMKGGITVQVWTLKVLDKLGILSRIPLLCIFNTDEEIGSNNSKYLFQNLECENIKYA
jgi:glutamate carboxypeptidase